MDASFVTAFIASVICSSDAIAGEQCCVVLAPARVDPQQLSMINQMQGPDAAARSWLSSSGSVDDNFKTAARILKEVSRVIADRGPERRQLLANKPTLV